MHLPGHRAAALTAAALLFLSACGSQPGSSGSISSGSGSSGSTSSSITSSGSTAGSGPEQNQDAKILNFEATDLDGQAVTSDDLFARSALTMLNVWGTYCNPCLKEMPDLGAMAADWDSSQLQIVGVVCDVEEGGEETMLQLAKDLVEETGAAYPHLLANRSLTQSFLGTVTAVPTTFFLDRDGTVLDIRVGSRDREAWEEIIHELLDQMA